MVHDHSGVTSCKYVRNQETILKVKIFKQFWISVDILRCVRAKQKVAALILVLCTKLKSILTILWKYTYPEV